MVGPMLNSTIWEYLCTGHNGQTVCQPVAHWCSVLCVYINTYVYTYIKSICKRKISKDMCNYNDSVGKLCRTGKNTLWMQSQTRYSPAIKVEITIWVV